MKTNRKHGFTIVELVVVIAIIAVLAAVLIPTFASIIKKANDSAYLQERTSQQIEDLAEKVENQNYLTWEDFEAVLARELAKVGSPDTEAIKNAVKVALAERAGSDNGLSEAQVQKIINEAMSGQLTTAQVQAIVEQSIKNAGISVGTSGGVTAAQVKSIVSAAIANIPTQTGVTPAMVQSAVASALANANVTVNQDDIAKALKAFGVSTLTEEQIVEIATQIATQVSEKTGNEKIVATLNIRAAGNEKATLYDTFGAMSISDPTTAVKSISAGETILWDSVDKKFVLDKDNTLTGARYWTVSDVISDKWSTYYTGTASTISTTMGFDAGTTTSVTSVTYTNTGAAQEVDVVIRTNGGTLTVDAKNDNVLHYGYADSVNVIDVATASYHENGTVKFLEVAAGHIVLEETSEVSAVHFDATNGKFENADGKTISIDLSKVNANDISFSRDAVTIAENGTYVAEVTTDGTEYIWLFGNGIKEQMVVTTTEGAIAENGTLNSGITAGAEDGSVAEQIANPAKRNEQGQLVDNDNNPVTVENAVVEEVASKEIVQTIAILFEGGNGTQENPYLISTFEALINVNAVSTGSETLYYRVVNDLEADDTDSWANGFLYKDPATYVIDLGGHSLTVKDADIFGYAVNLELYNGTIIYAGGGSVVGYACYQDMSSYNMNFHDLVLTGTAENSTSHYGPLVAYAFGLNSGSATINASKITNNMRIVNNVSNGYVGGLFGYVQGSAVSSSVTDCTFNGSIVAAYAGGFLNPCSFPNATSVVSSGNTVNGQLLASTTAIAFGCNGNLTGGATALTALQNTVSIGASAALTVVAPSSDLIYVDDNNQVILNRKDNVTTYRVAITFNVDKADGSSGGYPRYITVDLEQFTEAAKETGIYRYSIVQDKSDLSAGKTVVTEGNGYKIWLDGTTYHFYSPDYKISNNRATIWAYGYNNGNIVAYQSVGYSY